jgi:RNA polymerase sigma factor (sigma-70 family)
VIGGGREVRRRIAPVLHSAGAAVLTVACQAPQTLGNAAKAVLSVVMGAADGRGVAMYQHRDRHHCFGGCMNASIAGTAGSREAFDRLLGELRPKLHRYCARMTGSVIDGEDVVQEALAKAIEAFAEAGTIAHPERWLFRIAHNAALDFLRRRARQDAVRSGENPDMTIDPVTVAEDRQIVAASLRTFMRLPVAQRSSVILMDVLGYSLQEIGGILDSSIPAVKAALNRGRARLRELAQEPDDLPLPILAEPERSLLAGYVDRFNARDFDAIRDRRRGAARTRCQDSKEGSERSGYLLPQLCSARGLVSCSGTGGQAPGDARTRSSRSIRDAGIFRFVGVGRRQGHEHPRFSFRVLCD